MPLFCQRVQARWELVGNEKTDRNSLVHGQHNFHCLVLDTLNFCKRRCQCDLERAPEKNGLKLQKKPKNKHSFWLHQSLKKYEVKFHTSICKISIQYVGCLTRNQKYENDSLNVFYDSMSICTFDKMFIFPSSIHVWWSAKIGSSLKKRQL